MHLVPTNQSLLRLGPEGPKGPSARCSDSDAARQSRKGSWTPIRLCQLGHLSTSQAGLGRYASGSVEAARAIGSTGDPAQRVRPTTARRTQQHPSFGACLLGLEEYRCWRAVPTNPTTTNHSFRPLNHSIRRVDVDDDGKGGAGNPPVWTTLSPMIY